jgi:hypothetical protein
MSARPSLQEVYAFVTRMTASLHHFLETGPHTWAAPAGAGPLRREPPAASWQGSPAVPP